MTGHRPKRRPKRDLWDRPEAKAWREQHNRELLPMVRDSAVSMMLWPSDDEPDAKLAVELGFILLLGKPLVVLKPAGANVPAHLARLCEAIIEYDQLDETVMERVMAEYRRILAERGEELPDAPDPA